MRAVRLLLGAAGLAGAAYGAVLLLDLGTDNLRATVVWLVGGVVLHDAVLAPVTILAGAVLLRVGRAGVRTGPLVVAGVVLSTVTIAAVPVLGRWGARSDNPTLLDRNYVLGWVAFVGLTVLVTLLVALARGRRRP
jgi:hypothetical protein